MLLLPKNETRYPYTSYPVDYVLPEYIFSARTWKVLKYVMFSYASDADIIHSVFEYPYDLVATSIARKLKKPLVIGAAGTYAIKPLFYIPDKYLVKWAYNAARRIIAISAFTAQSVQKYSGTKTPLQVIHVGVNLGRFDTPVSVDEIIKRYGNKKILLTVGGLKRRKGQDVVLRALGELRRKRDDFHYLIVGSDEEGDSYITEMRAIVEEKKLHDRVTFVGSINDKELVRYFHAAYVYIHTPRVIHWNFEGFGIVYLEAGACHKPVIASDSGGVRDAVIEGKTGLIVPENDYLKTAEAIEKLLDNPDLARSMGNAGYEYAREHDWSRIASKYIDMYNELLGS
jgi:phosphatidylinositol alpha-1,6-mannosyltransferase